MCRILFFSIGSVLVTLAAAQNVVSLTPAAAIPSGASQILSPSFGELLSIAKRVSSAHLQP
jgi:hypothetical protein